MGISKAVSFSSVNYAWIENKRKLKNMKFSENINDLIDIMRNEEMKERKHRDMIENMRQERIFPTVVFKRKNQ